VTGPRAPLTAAALACAVLAAAVSVGLVRLHGAARDRLDQALGQRLLAVATVLAESVPPDSVRAVAWDIGGFAWADSARRSWRRTADRNGLAEIALVTPEGRILLSTTDNVLLGGVGDFWLLDEPAVSRACDQAKAVVEPTRLVGEVHQASVHAPVVVDDPAVGAPYVEAVVTVRARPDFFSTLVDLRRGAWVTLAVVLAVLVLVMAVLYRLQVSVQRARASLARQENLAAMGRMTAGIAHEIRNPLGIIRGAGQHLQRVLGEAGIEDEVADFIPEEVDRLDRILTGYLAFGRDADAEDEVFPLAAAVRRGVRTVEGELRADGIEVDVLAEADGDVRGDPRRLQQVLLNLLLNARDAMPGGGAVTVTIRRDGGSLAVAVADEGGGLDASAEQCFEPFWTSKEKGGGLGLSLSRRIVEGMGGALDLRNRTGGGGAVAELRLPAVTDAD
jgi:signal transduction histidine kinase